MRKSVRRWSQRFKASAVAALMCAAALSLQSALALEKNTADKKAPNAAKPQQTAKTEPGLAAPMSGKVDQRGAQATANPKAAPVAPVAKSQDVKVSAATGATGTAGSTAKSANDSKGAGTAKTATVVTKKTTVKKTVSKRRSDNMVPPPPPEMPNILTTDPQLMSISGLPLEYLTGEALRERQKDLKAQLLDIREDLALREKHCTDKIQRAQQFESLYQEGVVSRRELETAQMEASDCERDMARVKAKISDLDSLLKRVDERVAKQPGNKASKVTKVTTSKKKSK